MLFLLEAHQELGNQLSASLELAKELGIKHLIETDFIRAIVRGIIGPDDPPSLHKSSFDAYTTLRDKDRFNGDTDALIIQVLRDYASFVIPAIERVIRRAVDDYRRCCNRRSTLGS